MLTPIIDFSIINTHNTSENILVADTSRWGAIKNDPAIIEINHNGGRYFKDVFAKGRYNVMDSYKLFGDFHLELPDGLYEIKVTGSPDIHSKTRYLYRTNQLIRRAGYLYLNEGTQSPHTEALYKIFILVEGIEIHADKGELTQAKEKFDALTRMIETVEREYECKDCK